MDREHELIELGIVSVDTKGSLVSIDDTDGGFKPPALGLSDD